MVGPVLTVVVVTAAVVVTGLVVAVGTAVVVVTGLVVLVVTKAVVVTGLVVLVVTGAVVVTGLVVLVVSGAVVVTGLVVLVVTGAVVVTVSVVVTTGALVAVVFVAPLPLPALPGFPVTPHPERGPGVKAKVQWPPSLPWTSPLAQASAVALHIPAAKTNATAAQRRGCLLPVIAAVATSPLPFCRAFRPPARYFGARW